MVDNAKCQQQLRVAKDDSGATILNQGFDLDESFNCAGYDYLICCNINFVQYLIELLFPSAYIEGKRM